MKVKGLGALRYLFLFVFLAPAVTQAQFTATEENDFRQSLASLSLDFADESIQIRFLQQYRMPPVEMSEVEMVALFVYTKSYSEAINGALRRKATMQEGVAPLVRVLDRALRRLPVFSGTVYRGTTLPDVVLAGYLPGRVVSDRAFLSTTVEREQIFPGPHQFEIESCSGRKIDQYSHEILEREVLFPRNARFEVVTREPLPAGGIRFKLRELRDSCTALFHTSGE